MPEIVCTDGTRVPIDDIDAHLCQHRWVRVERGRSQYAKLSRGVEYLHRMILQPPPGFVVDHLDGNGLDCRRANMRLCTRGDNNRHQRRKQARATSRFKGVCWVKRRGHWIAQIVAHGRSLYLGSFATEEAAQDAYAAASISLHGEFAAPRVER